MRTDILKLSRSRDAPACWSQDPYESYRIQIQLHFISEICSPITLNIETKLRHKSVIPFYTQRISKDTNKQQDKQQQKTRPQPQQQKKKKQKKDEIVNSYAFPYLHTTILIPHFFRAMGAEVIIPSFAPHLTYL